MACVRTLTRRAALWQSTSLARVIAFIKCSIVSCSLDKQACSILDGCAELCLWALDAVLRSLLLPLAATFGEERLATCSWPVAIALISTSSDGLDRGAHRRGNSDCIGIVAGTTLDTITGRQEGVESLDQIGMPCEELRYSVDNPWCINAVLLLAMIPASTAIQYVTYA